MKYFDTLHYYTPKRIKCNALTVKSICVCPVQPGGHGIKDFQ